MVTINPALGLCDTNQGLESFIYYLGSFFEEILNMITVNPVLGLCDADQGYYISPGPIFHVDSESEVRIPKFHLSHTL